LFAVRSCSSASADGASFRTSIMAASASDKAAPASESRKPVFT
jgi:hypothetical protein